MKLFLQDQWRASTKLRQAAPWIGLAIGLTVCAAIIIYDALREPPATDQQVPVVDWWFFAALIARLIFVGFAAALFTRFFGSVGMYKDAISDLFREDTWLDRRNDLEDLWRDVTRRVFMPGSDPSGHKDLISEVNSSMSQMLGDEKTRKPYFLEQEGYEFYITWNNQSKGLVDITFNRQFDLYPFSPGSVFEYTYKLSSTSDVQIDAQNLRQKSLSINNTEIFKNYVSIVNEIELGKYYSKKFQNGMIEVKIRLGDALKPVDGKKYQFGIGMVLTQKIDDDPIFLQEMAQVVRDLSVTLRVAPQDGINAVFEEIGVGGAFVRDQTEAPEQGIVKRKTVRALLPRQGFAIIMARRDPAADIVETAE